MNLFDKFKKLEPKQKGIVILTIVIALVVIYLAYTTFFPASNKSPSTSTDIKPTTQFQSRNQQLSSSSGPSENGVSQLGISRQAGSVNSVSSSSASVESNSVQAIKSESPTPQDLALLAESQKMQQEYVKLVNQYQLAQLEQKLVDVNSQIASSKVSMTKSLIELRQEKGLLGTGSDLDTGTGSGNNKGYNIVYVGAVSGQWQAMLSANGQYFQVKPGMHLPDGSTVTQISNRGIVLTRVDGTPVFLPISKNLD